MSPPGGAEAPEKTYARALEELKTYADTLPKSRMHVVAKVTALAVLNMRWEAVMVNRELSAHPYPLVAAFVDDARAQLTAWSEASFIEGDDAVKLATPQEAMEKHHHDLFQALWVKFSSEDYNERIDRYVWRLRINRIGGDLLAGRRCIDLGCGHGNFAHALLREGAGRVLGIDYGEASIRYAEEARDRLEVSADRLQFRVESVYDVHEPSASTDFALQNGVFHHLEHEDRAYREAHRLLKAGGWLWVYTDGEGAVSHDLWDASVHILREVPPATVLECLDFLNVGTNKRYHLGDGLNAIYRHTSWDALTERLGGMGFGNFRRLVGGFPTDFDHDAIAADPYGSAKFGSGDLRLLAQKL